MRILSGYVAREFLKIFSLLLVVFVGIYVGADLQRIEGFLKFNPSWNDIINYYLNKIPLIIFQVVSVAVLLATSLTLANLTKSNEITAMKAAGISIYRVIAPILEIAFLISLLTLLANEYVLPVTNKKAEYIRQVKIRGEKPRSIFKNGRIWFNGDGGIIYNIQNIFPQQEMLEGVTIYYFDQDFKLLQRVDAAKVRWDNGKWVSEDGSLYRFNADGSFENEVFEKKSIALKETPDDFKQVERKPDAMSYHELRSYIQDLRSKGYDVGAYLVDLYAKQALPFISFVMAIIGAPFALRLNRSGGKAVGFALTLGLGFVYWIVLSLGLAVGHGGVLPPVIAGWGANVLFASLGFYLLGNLH